MPFGRVGRFVKRGVKEAKDHGKKVVVTGAKLAIRLSPGGQAVVDGLKIAREVKKKAEDLRSVARETASQATEE